MGRAGRVAALENPDSVHHSFWLVGTLLVCLRRDAPCRLSGGSHWVDFLEEEACHEPPGVDPGLCRGWMGKGPSQNAWHVAGV